MPFSQRGLQANPEGPGRAGLLTPPGKKTSTPQADEIGPSPNVTSPAFLIWHEMSVACGTFVSLLSLSPLPHPSPLSIYLCALYACVQMRMRVWRDQHVSPDASPPHHLTNLRKALPLNLALTNWLDLLVGTLQACLSVHPPLYEPGSSCLHGRYFTISPVLSKVTN